MLDEGDTRAEGADAGRNEPAAAAPPSGRGRRRWVAALPWLAVIAVIAMVAVSNHWLADAILALLPVVGIAAFIVVGMVVAFRRRRG